MNQLLISSQLIRSALFSGLLLTTLLGACGKDDDKDPAPAAGDGTVTWTHNGRTYTSTVRSSAIVDGTDKMLITGGTEDNNNIVSLALQGISTRGAGVYDLRRGSVLDDLPVAVVTLNAGGGQGAFYNTLYAPSPSNGSITVSQYDRTGQKISGTFTFTGGAVPNGGASGTQTVTNGSFTFTRFR